MKNWLQDNLSKIKQALFKTKAVLSNEEDTNTDTSIDINDGLFEDLFERLIKADIGADLSDRVVSNLKKQFKVGKVGKSEFYNTVKLSIKEVLKIDSPNSFVNVERNKFNVLFIVGVNGSGKTTSIGKLAKRFKDQELKVLIVAADTFRAAAGEQLDIWAKRAGVEIYSPPEIKKPDAVVFSAIEKAKNENYNLLLIDTAGRLHSQTNLMEELKKINSIIEKNTSNANIEKLIVLDATIGQNAITQAELFTKSIGLTGIVLAKLDSSAKGGVVLNIINKLSLPVKLIGTGEKIDDLADFNFDQYLEGLIS